MNTHQELDSEITSYSGTGTSTHPPMSNFLVHGCPEQSSSYWLESVKDEIMSSITDRLGEGFVDGIKTGRVITWQDSFFEISTSIMDHDSWSKPWTSRIPGMRNDPRTFLEPGHLGHEKLE